MSDQQPPLPAPSAGPPGPTGPSYGAGGPGYGAGTNGMAIASLVFGILGLTLLFGIGSILALIFGYVARGQIKRSQETQGGRGLALGGIVLGWIGVAISILLIALAIAGVFVLFSSDAGDTIREEFEAGFAEGTLENVAAVDAGCTPVETFPGLGRSHIRPDAVHLGYNSDPPTSGPHHPAPAQPGFYTKPVAPETLVHNLEHGQVVIWFHPEADGLLKDQIEVLVGQQPSATVAVPYERAPSQGFVMTAWRHSQTCRLASQEAVDDFRREFQGRGPEPVAPPFDS